MSNIVLVVTGALTTGQPYLPYILPKLSIQLDNHKNKTEKPKPSHLSPIVSRTEIAPPEFILADSSPIWGPQAGALRNKKQMTRLSISNNPALPTLRFGNTGNSVRVLQWLLLTHGYAIEIDGIFGALTETAVKAFQNRRNLVVDGIVGQKTWYQLTK